MVQYAKTRWVGGVSTYARSYGEGLMLFTYDKERKMIPVWVSRFVANQIRKSVEVAEEQFWDDGFMAWRQFARKNLSQKDFNPHPFLS